jgi:hypothetical protein
MADPQGPVGHPHSMKRSGAGVPARPVNPHRLKTCATDIFPALYHFRIEIKQSYMCNILKNLNYFNEKPKTV